MSNKNDRWSALSMKERADLMNMYITNGISDLKEMKKHYNGIPYRDLNTSDYDYFNASPEMAPTEEGQHWDSRNPHTGRLLKGENHPTFDLMVEGENKAGYKIVRGYNGELYSIPSTPDNYVENYNSFGDGGNTDSKREMAEIDADYFLRGWYNNPTTQAMMDQLDTRDYSKYPVVTPNGKEVTDPHLARRVRVSSALNTPVNYVEFPENKGGDFVFRNSNPKDNDININQDLWGNALMSALVHEGDHAVQYEMPFVLQTTQPVKHELKAGYLPDKYLDNRKEIRSRIMSTREALNLDPNKRDYTPEEAAAIQQQLVDNKHLHRDNAQLDRLTPETMAGYLNYLADSDAETSATPVGGVRSAKHGGRILSGKENQNNEEVLYYDDTYVEAPVVKAFNSSKDYNRYRGKQFGKKIAKKTNDVAQSIVKGLQYVPVIGDIIDAENAVIEASKGNYKEAAALSGMLVLPNLIEKPIKGLKRGLKNIATYKKYASQSERFRPSVDEIVDRYIKNADLLNSNYGGTDTKRILNTKEDLITANKNLSITTNYIPLSRKKGGKYNGDIWINPYGKGRLKKAWKSPIEAIKDLHGTAAHEGTHFALYNLNDKLTIYDKSRKYPKANPNHPLYQDVGYIFDDLNREATAWERSPEEFIAELNKFRVNNNIPNHLGYNQWKPVQKRMAQTAMANRFKLRPEDASYIAPEDIDFIISKYADFGYKNGGKLTKKCK